MQKYIARILASVIPFKKARKKYRRRLMQNTLIEKECSPEALKAGNDPAANTDTYLPLDESDLVQSGPSKIFIQGMGLSGASAARDYVAEFKGVYLFPDEFDLIRHSGGLLEGAALLPLNDQFIGDSFIRRAFRLAEYCSSVRKWEDSFQGQFLKYSQDFLNSLIMAKIDYPGRVFSPHEMISYASTEALFQEIRKKTSEASYDTGIYLMKNISLQEYTALAKKYLEDIFSLLNKAPKKIFVHMFSASSPWDMQADFLSDYKVIFVRRDPRDVYTTMMKILRESKNPDNIYLKANEDVFFFIEDYKRALTFHEHNKKLMGCNLLCLQFEDCVLNYKKTSKKINAFLHLNSKHHVRRKEFFNPEKSIKTIGIYKDFPDKEAIAAIEKYLPEYCYNQKRKNKCLNVC